ncbi:AraC family transcriptional regulator [Agrobacterium genomosp. 3]|uniref:AraC family transcriptional regulator n=1 Tax=Agrobacterium TaxID=357 RepID=UPI001CD914C5|nr:AraC family transcriptional regulator [Agrobacterium pusense]MCA1867941.1 AraC family transcriptional regulator [Agrobacterium tomkonis]MCA1878366.1 AraC family transcriptional regulator [Agrobacterium tumefaciens]MCA1893516.1 AraC family transcriptional regulator [Agrobacterium tomkonis]MDH0117048.1 AraC family transcriptional regulator [Agrobacterium pusense]MDH0872574.1 AraC family transcriptional regulator [Agrobacterium pusense]
MTTLDALIDLARRHGGKPRPVVPRLSITVMNAPTAVGAMIYEPNVCLVLQGQKRVFIGEKIVEYGEGRCMVVAAEVAALAQISKASPSEPYLAITLAIDASLIAALLLEMHGFPEVPLETGFASSAAGPELLEAWFRLMKLYDRPQEIPVMARAMEYELMFRLMMGAQGGLIRQISGPDTRLSHIRRAMAWIRDNHAKSLSIEAMASVAGMSLSVFHRHFKAISGLTPLQYQKHFRLHEARRLMVADRAEAATVGFTVGYESASQFSREYKRLFGQPPRRDVQSVQSEVPAVRLDSQADELSQKIREP